MSDLISRQAAISAICNACGKIDCDKMDKCEKLQLSSANCSEFPNNSDTISRQAAINVIERTRAYIGHNMERAVGAAFIEILDDVGEDIGRLPPVQFATDTNVGIKLGTNLAQLGTDCISRQQAVDALRKMQTYKLFSGDDMLLIDQAGAQTELMLLPPAQLDTYWKEQCQSYEQTINKLRESLSTQPEIVRCKDCYWWTKQEDSSQGRCALLQMYPTGGWFCGNARRREVTE